MSMLYAPLLTSYAQPKQIIHGPPSRLFNTKLPMPREVFLPGLSIGSLVRGIAPTQIGNGVPVGTRYGAGLTGVTLSRRYPTEAHGISGQTRFAWVCIVVARAFTGNRSQYRHDGVFTALQSYDGWRWALWNASGITLGHYRSPAAPYADGLPYAYVFGGRYTETLHTYQSYDFTEYEPYLNNPGSAIATHANPMCFGATESDGEQMESFFALPLYAVWVGELPSRRQMLDLMRDPWSIFAPAVAAIVAPSAAPPSFASGNYWIHNFRKALGL